MKTKAQIANQVTLPRLTRALHIGTASPLALGATIQQMRSINSGATQLCDYVVVHDVVNHFTSLRLITSDGMKIVNRGAPKMIRMNFPTYSYECLDTSYMALAAPLAVSVETLASSTKQLA